MNKKKYGVVASWKHKEFALYLNWFIVFKIAFATKCSWRGVYINFLNKFDASRFMCVFDPEILNGPPQLSVGAFITRNLQVSKHFDLPYFRYKYPNGPVWRFVYRAQYWVLARLDNRHSILTGKRLG